MNVELGQIVKGTVTGITKFGAFVKLESGKSVRTIKALRSCIYFAIERALL